MRVASVHARWSVFVALLLLGACDAPTGPVDDRAVVATDAVEYEATTTPLPAAVGYLNRYDYDIVLRVQNHSNAPMVLDGCDGGWIWTAVAGDVVPLDREAAQSYAEVSLLSCGDVEHVMIPPGESRIHHIRIFGYSSDALFMSVMDTDIQVVLSARGGALRTAPFVLRTPEFVP